MITTFFYRGIPRLDWGFENPNMTAALIAMLAVATIGAGLIWKRVFWLLAVVSCGLIIALIHTLSRGGMVAFIVGTLCMIIAIRPSLSRPKIIGVAMMILVLVLYSYHMGGAARYIQGLNGVEDRSIGNRWLIYRAVPRMILDAPGGWGMNQAANAFHQWYQPEGRTETYSTLVNSHFTWLVEWSTWKRLLYGFAWALILVFTWPRKEYPWWGTVFGVWVTLFIAACFTSVGHRLWIWPFPVMLLIVCLIQRLMAGRYFERWKIAIAAVASLGGYFLILSIAVLVTIDVPPLRHRDGSTIVGFKNASEKIAVYGNDRRILGEKFGHRFRNDVKSHPRRSITFYESGEGIDNMYSTIVLVGAAFEKMGSISIDNVVLLNPSDPGNFVEKEKDKSLLVIWGEMNPSPAWFAWQQKALTREIELIRIPGEGLFLESWLTLLSR
jgi:hypothetical protein